MSDECSSYLVVDHDVSTRVRELFIVPAGHVYSSGGVCVGAQGGRGGKWGALLVAGIQIQGVITYSAL